MNKNKKELSIFAKLGKIFLILAFFILLGISSIYFGIGLFEMACEKIGQKTAIIVFIIAGIISSFIIRYIFEESTMW